VRRDVQSDLVWLLDETRHPALAFAGTGAQSRKVVSVRDLASSLAPPIGWTIGAIVGLVIGGALAARARSLERHAHAIGYAMNSTLSKGSVTDSDARTARFYALVLATSVLCAGPLIDGLILEQW
jgi:hypothetical protein